MPMLQQHGEVFVGPGSKREAQLLGLGLTKLSSRRKDDLHLAKRYAMDVSIKQIMLRQQKAHHENQQKQAMYAQALSLMARVYIGSISFEVREEMIKKAFEVYGPIKSINMSWDPTTGHHKGFAFLEFDVPEAALLAQESMNGQLMGGRNLKVGRPSNMPQAQPIIEMVQQDAKKYHRVYVSSVHPDLSESDLKSVFEAFGEVVKCQLARQSATGKGSHRGFGYIEFNNAAAMNEAIAGMNMFDLGGQFLRAAKAQGSGSNSPRPMSPAPATPPVLPPPGVACPSPPTVVAPTLAQPKLAVPPPVAVATPHLYNPPPVSQVPPVSYPSTDYGVPPPPLNGYPPMASGYPPVPPPLATQRGFGGFAHPAGMPGVPPVPPPVAPLSAHLAGVPPPPPSAPRTQPPAAKGERSFEEKVRCCKGSRIRFKFTSSLSSPAPATPPVLPPPGVACPSPPTVVAPTLAQPKLAVPPPVAVATPHLYNPPPVAQVPPVSYPSTDYGVPPPPLNGYPPMAPGYPPVPPPLATQRGFGGFAHPAGMPGVPPVPPPVAPLSAHLAGVPPPPPSAPRTQPPAAKGERSFEEKMDRILERTKAKQEAKLAMPVTFGAIDPLFAPKDPLAEDEQSDGALAITAKANQDVQSMALALIGDNSLALKGQKVVGYILPCVSSFNHGALERLLKFRVYC
ncbi:poly-U binding splicing factor, half-pint family [Oesophagostomum dentatum]|uniref:Poly-U binding splicing factor, half-pint family n=1 Tax=Oesophagostomum dentatum TaxID=61180 RepID=A0A0B1SS32_OESDE|nr:poly-U binding splicing factor, half-pint family [Oesophagostomum dentatum]